MSRPTDPFVTKKSIRPIRTLRALVMGLIGALAIASACQKVEIQPSTEQITNRNREAIERYLADRGITDFRVSPLGAFVVIDSTGPESMPLDTGRIVFVKYRGRFLDRDTLVFDSTQPNRDLLRVTIGNPAGLIAGFGDGIGLFRSGERGRIFVPSQLGYGNAGASGIPPNSNLIFDIRIVRVQ